jgi:hypothetical protein
MDQVITAIKLHFHLFRENGILFIICAVMLLYLVSMERKELGTWLFAVYTVILALLYCIPFTANIIMKYCIGEEVYWRMFWLVPFAMAIAFGVVKLLERVKFQPIQLLCFIIAVVFLITTGTPVYNRDNFVKAANDYKLPEASVAVCDAINANASGQDEAKLIVVPAEIVSYIRQYDASIKMLYGRRPPSRLGKTKRYILDAMTGGVADWPTFADMLKKTRCTYYVCHNDLPGKENIVNYGYELVAEVAGYAVYHLV